MFSYCFKKSANNLLKFENRNLNQIRSITSNEIAIALRPFYFIVHPDLFGRHPQQRNVNEESLKHLGEHLEALQQHRHINNAPNNLRFYIRDSNSDNRDSFKLISISMIGVRDAKIIVKKVLESCKLSTEYVDAIKSVSKTSQSPKYPFARPNDQSYGFGPNVNYENFYYSPENIKDIRKKTLNSWIKENIDTAQQRSKDLEKLKEEVLKLEKILTKDLNLKEIRYDCGWNYDHYRGCLKTLETLARLHPHQVAYLKNRIVVFASFTGVSLEGHVMLFTGDVLNNWVDFLKNIPQHDDFLEKIPSYEFALSQVLRNIRIARRKFMPKQQAVGYAGHLRKMTTTILDYLSTKKYPKSWPEDLSDFEIVVESEAGPLMVSPTGQLIAPATIPGFMLVDFITCNLEEAKEKAHLYTSNKEIEKQLVIKCVQQFKLKDLTKDDSVTTDKMIKTVGNLLQQGHSNHHLQDIHLHITNYYSILSDGIVCIPWDFEFGD